MKILFTADLHGNEEQYRKLVDYVIESSASAVIVGGDIAPKDNPTDFIGSQRMFFKDRLPELLSPLKEEMPNTRVFMMMGNDDCLVNEEVFRKHDGSLYQDLHMQRYALNEDFDIVGYAHVPITPFGLKDWERYDLSNGEIHPTARIYGVRSTESGFEDFLFFDEDKQHSIESELDNDIFTKTPEKTVYVIHAPPYMSNLDQVYTGFGVSDACGSKGVRSFIEQNQPYITLHGHIHETVDISGEFVEDIGSTYCFSSGNHNVGPLKVLVFDLYMPEKAERIVL